MESLKLFTYFNTIFSFHFTYYVFGYHRRCCFFSSRRVECSLRFQMRAMIVTQWTSRTLQFFLVYFYANRQMRENLKRKLFLLLLLMLGRPFFVRENVENWKRIERASQQWFNVDWRSWNEEKIGEKFDSLQHSWPFLDLSLLDSILIGADGQHCTASA